MRELGKRAVKRFFNAAGYQISRKRPQPPTPAVVIPLAVDRSTMRGALVSLGQRLPSIATIIDVGASTGIWSSQALESYPHSRYWLIEAQPVHEPDLRKFCRQHANAGYVLAAAGAEIGLINFDSSSPWGGVAGHTRFQNNIVVPVTTIDEQARAQRLTGPFLLKLDTHGYEVPILTGASATLPATAAIVVECYNFKSVPECLQFYELCAWLKERGFRCIDLVDLLRRPGDDVFWQMDMVFVRADRPEFSQTDYA